MSTVSACAVCGRPVHDADRFERGQRKVCSSRCGKTWELVTDFEEFFARGEMGKFLDAEIAPVLRAARAWHKQAPLEVGVSASSPRLKVSNPHDLLDEAIRGGALLGYRRAFKHKDDPSEDEIVEAVTRGVIEAIGERFTLEP